MTAMRLSNVRGEPISINELNELIAVLDETEARGKKKGEFWNDEVENIYLMNMGGVPGQSIDTQIKNLNITRNKFLTALNKGAPSSTISVMTELNNERMADLLETKAAIEEEKGRIKAQQEMAQVQKEKLEAEKLEAIRKVNVIDRDVKTAATDEGKKQTRLAAEIEYELKPLRAELVLANRKKDQTAIDSLKAEIAQREKEAAEHRRLANESARRYKEAEEERKKQQRRAEELAKQQEEQDARNDKKKQELLLELQRMQREEAQRKINYLDNEVRKAKTKEAKEHTRLAAEAEYEAHIYGVEEEKARKQRKPQETESERIQREQLIDTLKTHRERYEDDAARHRTQAQDADQKAKEAQEEADYIRKQQLKQQRTPPKTGGSTRIPMTPDEMLAFKQAQARITTNELMVRGQQRDYMRQILAARMAGQQRAAKQKRLAGMYLQNPVGIKNVFEATDTAVGKVSSLPTQGGIATLVSILGLFWFFVLPVNQFDTRFTLIFKVLSGESTMIPEQVAPVPTPPPDLGKVAKNPWLWDWGLLWP